MRYQLSQQLDTTIHHFPLLLRLVDPRLHHAFCDCFHACVDELLDPHLAIGHHHDRFEDRQPRFRYCVNSIVLRRLVAEKLDLDTEHARMQQTANVEAFFSLNRVLTRGRGSLDALTGDGLDGVDEGLDGGLDAGEFGLVSGERIGEMGRCRVRKRSDGRQRIVYVRAWW
jgi:hypothetical protein